MPATNAATVEEEEVVRAEKVAAIDDLKERLAKAETASDEYRKQAEVLQARFDEVTKEHVKYEEKCHELEEQTETLQNEKREATRKIRELEGIYEAEHSAMVKEKEEMGNREEELQMIIARLKDSLNQQKMSNNDDEPRPSRSGALIIFTSLTDKSHVLTGHSRPDLSGPGGWQLCPSRIPFPQRLAKSIQVNPPKGQAD